MSKRAAWLGTLGAAAAGLAILLLTISGYAPATQENAAVENNDKLQRGPKVGEAIPAELVALDQAGVERDLSAIVGDRGVVLMFSRSFDWCVFCKQQAIAWNEKLPEVRELGFELAALTYDSVDDLARFAGRQNIDYTLFSDPESEIIKAFDVLNERESPGSFSYGIAHPIIFVIGGDGVVRHRFSEEAYRRRPNVDIVVRALREEARHDTQ